MGFALLLSVDRVIGEYRVGIKDLGAGHDVFCGVLFVAFQETKGDRFRHHPAASAKSWFEAGRKVGGKQFEARDDGVEILRCRAQGMGKSQLVLVDA
jgi:hypothetical protein